MLAYAEISRQVLTNPANSDLRGLLHAPDMAACGERLSAYDFGPNPDVSKLSAPPRGEELRRAANSVLGANFPRP